MTASVLAPRAQAAQHRPLRFAQRPLADQCPLHRFVCTVALGQCLPVRRQLPQRRGPRPVRRSRRTKMLTPTCRAPPPVTLPTFGRIPFAVVEVGGDVRGDLAPQITEMQRSEPDGDRIRSRARFQARARSVRASPDSKPCNDALAPFEADADDLRVKTLRLADRREAVALEIGVALGE